MYHLYTVEICCDGLASADFATLEFEQKNAMKEKQFAHAYGWRWITWPQIIDTLHGRIKALDRLDGVYKGRTKEQTEQLASLESFGEKLATALAGLRASVPAEDSDLVEVALVVEQLERLTEHTKGSLERLAHER